MAPNDITGDANAEDLANTMLKVGNIDVTLAQLANLSADDVKAVRFEQLNVGTYTFKGVPENCTIRIVDVQDTDKDNNKITDGNGQPVMVKRGVFDIEGEVIAVHGAIGFDSMGNVDPAFDKESLIGKKHRESFFVKDADAAGRVKAFVEDGWGKPAAVGKSMQELLAFVGANQWVCGIRHQADRNDKDRKFAHFDKVRPVPAA